MNAGKLVGHVTRPNGSPVSGVEIWISWSGESGNESKVKPVATTDSRGYFQLAFNGCGSNITEVGGKLNISVGTKKDVHANFKANSAAESQFEVNGYLIRETLSSDA